MEKNGDKKFTWVFKDLTTFETKKSSSDTFVIGGCNWRIDVIPSGDKFFLYLVVPGYQLMSPGWKRRANYRLTIVNHLSKELSVVEEGVRWFEHNTPVHGGKSERRLLTEIHSKDGGFLRNGQVEIVAEVDVLEVIGKFDVPIESEETTKLLRNIEETDGADSSKDLLKQALSVKETIDVNGFQVLPSQVESVRCIFERHQDIAVEFRAKNQHLRNSCMSFLLSLVETLSQSLQELSNEDIVETDIALTYLKDAGFKVDWLENTLDLVREKKEKERSCLANLQETGEILVKLRQKCRELDALMEIEKEELSATRTPLSFEDVV